MKNIYHPPVFGETLISLLLTEENTEDILGDLAEVFNVYAHRDNLRKAQIWYYVQIFRSAPPLAQLKLSNFMKRSFETMSVKMNLHNKSSIWISLIAIIPALVLVIPGILQSGFGYFGANDARDTAFATVPVLEFLLNPVTIMGGLFLAFVMNVLPAMTFHLERKPEGLTSTITLKPVILHWIFIGLSILMVSIIMVYAFFENFAPAFH
jgi:hypothetical protein